MLAGGVFFGVFLGRIAQSSDVRVGKQSVVVDIHLAVQGQQATIGGDNQRVDFNLAGILIQEKRIKPLHEFGQGADLFALQPQPKSDVPALIRLQTGAWINFLDQNFFRGFCGNLFNLHATLTRSHEQHPLAGPID